MLDDLPIYTTKPSVANSDLRTTNQVSDNKLNSTLMDALIRMKNGISKV